MTILASRACSGFVIVYYLLQTTTELTGTFAKWLAIGYAIVDVYLGQMFYTISFLVMSTKYLLIYHGEQLAFVNDNKLLLGMKVALILVPGILVAIEFLIFTSFEDMSVFQVRYYGQARPTAKLSVVSRVSTVIVMTIVGLLQIRTEYDSLMAQDNQSGFLANILTRLRTCRKPDEEQQREEKELPYSMNTIRVLLVFTSLGRHSARLPKSRRSHINQVELFDHCLFGF